MIDIKKTTKKLINVADVFCIEKKNQQNKQHTI